MDDIPIRKRIVTSLDFLIKKRSPLVGSTLLRRASMFSGLRAASKRWFNLNRVLSVRAESRTWERFPKLVIAKMFILPKQSKPIYKTDFIKDIPK